MGSSRVGGRRHGEPAGSCTYRQSSSGQAGPLRCRTLDRARLGASSTARTCSPQTGDSNRCRRTARCYLAYNHARQSMDPSAPPLSG